MLKDRYGNTLLTTSKSARDAYVDTVDRFLAADGGVEEAFHQAFDADENFALAHLGLARNLQMRGERLLIAAPLAMARAEREHLTAREAGQVAALGLLLEGNVPDAYKAIITHLKDFPRDAMVSHTCMGVFSLIGFSGQPGREAE